MSNRRVRTAYFVSTVSVSLALFLVGAIAYIIMNMEMAATGLLNEVSISALLSEEISQERLSSLQGELSQIEGVTNVSYTSKSQAAEDFKGFIGSDFTLIIEENPLPASLEISLGEDIENSELMRSIVKSVEAMDGVEEVLAQDSVIGQVMDNIYRFKLIMFAFGAALSLVSLLLINNTIRMAILSKRFIIKTMRLVGATNSFIRTPFIKGAFAQGFWATLLASAALFALIFALKQSMPEIELITSDLPRFAMLFGGMLVVGVLLCVISTIISVNKFIKLDDNNLHIY